MPPSTIPIDQIQIRDSASYPRPIDKNMIVRNWPTNASWTVHTEYLVSEICYLIEADTPCSGCTIIKNKNQILQL